MQMFEKISVVSLELVEGGAIDAESTVTNPPSTSSG
jgi:hypothetical protein